MEQYTKRAIYYFHSK